MLILTYFDKDFLVCTNVDVEGIGGVFIQDGKVVSYESKKLNNHEKNYSKS
jgi:hypothetical protein